MRHLIIFGILIFDSYYAYSQSDCVFYYDSIANRKIYTFADKMPEYDNNNANLLNLLSSIQMDTIPEVFDTRGKVSFIVEIDGKITNIKIIDTINEKIDKSVIDFFGRANKWKCGYCNGIAVPYEMIIPYQFDFQ